MNDTPGRAQAREEVRLGDPAATWSEHRIFGVYHILGRSPFESAEVGFAVGSENRADAAPLDGFDLPIEVNEWRA